MSLYDELAKIGQQVKSQLPQMKNNETATVQVSVLPFIRALGYNTEDLSEVYPEYAILNMDAVDFAVLRNSEPIMVLEAKKASENLNAKHWKQLFEYFNADKARIGILTNGLEYRLYTDSVTKNIMDTEPFLIINLDDLDKVSVAHLEGFTKGRFHPELSLRKIKISNLLAMELRRPSDEFVRYFAKQIHAGAVFQNVIEEFRPIVEQCWGELIEREIARRIWRNEEPHDEPSESPSESENEKPDSPIGVIEIPIFATHMNYEFEATLLVDEIMNWHKRVIEVKYDNEIMSLNDATLRALRKASPKRKTGKAGVRFWKFIHPVSRQILPINDICKDVQGGGPLRQQFINIADN